MTLSEDLKILRERSHPASVLAKHPLHFEPLGLQPLAPLPVLTVLRTPVNCPTVLLGDTQAILVNHIFLSIIPLPEPAIPTPRPARYFHILTFYRLSGPKADPSSS